MPYFVRASYARLLLAAVLASACDSATTPPSNPTKVGFVVQPAVATAGALISPLIKVAIQDDQGRTVTSSTATVTLALGVNPGFATLLGTTTVAAVSGVATFSDLRLERAAAGYTLAATSAGLAEATSSAFVVNPAAAAKTAFVTQPSTATAGATMTPDVQVGINDAFDNLVTSSTIPVTIAIGTNVGSGTLSGTTTLAAAGGVATFTGISINKSGVGYTLAASAPNLTNATSGTFTVNGAAATKIVFMTQPSAATAAAAMAPSIQVAARDAFDNVANTATGAVTVAIGYNAGLGVLSGTTTVALSSGIATFTDLSLNKAANSYTLVATYQAFDAVLSTPFNVVAGAAVKTAFGLIGGSFRSGDAMGTPVRVVVWDANDNIVKTATNQITLSIGTNPSGGTLSGTLTIPAVDGIATFTDVSIDKVGTGYTIVASASALQGSTSSAFAIEQGEPAKLVFIDQPIANNDAGIGYPTIRVAAQDAGGNLILDRGMTVTLTVGTSASGGSVVTTSAGANSVSISQGIATFNGIKLNRPGTYTLKASGGGFAKESGQTVVKQEFAKITVGGGPAFSFPITESRHSCSLSTAGVAHCWGGSIWGAMGIYTSDATAIVTQPELVTTSLLFKDISAGNIHTCAVTTAGAAHCWGSNLNGRLGDGTPGTKATPSPVAGTLHFVSISAGDEHTCGVTSSGPGVLSGPVYCWGHNDVGQVGDGTFTERTTPTLVSGGYTFIAVSAARGSHTCAITTAFLAYCWGANANGQLGDASTTTRNVPTLVTDAGTHLFRSISTGRAHTCAVRADNATYCWGSNANQQIGDGNSATTNRTAPALVTAAFSAASAGWFHNCAIGSGTALCWGENGGGQLGDGGTTQRGAPAAVTGSPTITQVSAGEDHSCGVTVEKYLYCWGINDKGQLGDGTTTQRLSPARVFAP
jgi:alpha-tubulin suppressor-like RCC1 family protein